jgi:hypothetical protein
MIAWGNTMFWFRRLLWCFSSAKIYWQVLGCLECRAYNNCRLLTYDLISSGLAVPWRSGRSGSCPLLDGWLQGWKGGVAFGVRDSIGQASKLLVQPHFDHNISRNGWGLVIWPAITNFLLIMAWWLLKTRHTKIIFNATRNIGAGLCELFCWEFWSWLMGRSADVDLGIGWMGCSIPHVPRRTLRSEILSPIYNLRVDRKLLIQSSDIVIERNFRVGHLCRKHFMEESKRNRKHFRYQHLLPYIDC